MRFKIFLKIFLQKVKLLALFNVYTCREQNLKLIFEKFYRVDNARSSQTGGSGLGLSIAKRIVELHGGLIEASSDWEHTTFTVTLPGIHNPTQKVEAQKKEEEEDPLTRHQRLGTNKKSESGKKNRRRI